MTDQEDLYNTHFVHCAIPDMAISEADTSCTICGIPTSVPIGVLIDDRNIAAQKSLEKPGIIFIADSSGTAMAFKDGKTMPAKGSGFKIVKVGDGVNAAKALRIFENSIPCIEEKDTKKLELYTKQLKIAMFLTNSKNIDSLKKAPIYNTKGM